MQSIVTGRIFKAIVKLMVVVMIAQGLPLQQLSRQYVWEFDFEKVTRILSLIGPAVAEASESETPENDPLVFDSGQLSINAWHFHYSRHKFSVTNPGSAIVTVTKATTDKEIRGGFLFFNHKFIPLSSFFSSPDQRFEKEIKLRRFNRLNVFLNGDPGASIVIKIQWADIPNPPPSVTYTADPLSITMGDISTLSWQASNADTVSIDNNIGTVDLNGSVEVYPSETTTYTLTASGPGGVTIEEVTVTVTYLPPSVSLSADPDTIVTGQSSLLTWTSEYAESCVIEPDIGVVDLNGEMSVSPTATTQYRIVATGPGGSAEADVTVTVTDPPPTVDITATPSAIALGESATLEWTSTDAASCTIEPDIGAVDPNGSISVTPTDTTTYTITATGTGGTASAQVSVAITKPLPTISFAASPSSIQIGFSSNLSWSTTHADTVEIDQGIGAVGASGTLEVNPVETTTYALTATGPGGTATVEVTVTVTHPAPTVNFQATPDTITRGQSAELGWTSDYASGATIDQGVGTVPVDGSVTVSPTETTTYTITLTGTGGTTTASVTVTVNTPPPTASLTADPDTIILGNSSTLQWTTTDADSVTIEPGIGAVAANGSLNISPSDTTTYTLTATGPGGSVTRAVTITVFYPPTVILSADPAIVTQGESTTLSWNATNTDSCTIEPDVGAVAVSGSIDVTPDQDTTYTITATGTGGTATAQTSVTVVPSGPPTVTLDPASSTIAQGESVTLTWTSIGADSAHMDNGVGDVATAGSLNVSPNHTTTYTLTVTGAKGATSTQAVVYVTGSPDPQPEGAFGYMYNNLIPQDATVPYYEENRFAMVVGIVQDANAVPLEGVSVSIHSRPEYGTAFTDDQGRFSLPVEGGSWMIVVYQKQGFITAHRKVDAPWNNFISAETITMLEHDPKVTTITFDGDPGAVVTHQSTPISDDAGTRSTTLVFTGDNRAYWVDENGNDISELTTITARATEFTTPASMPAVLPPTSAYTYCAELTVDGVQNVRFEKPVVMWVDNFIGFPVGEIVPVGSYDRIRGLWIPEENGVVVELLDTDNDGIVDSLDANGDGLPDDLDQDGTFDDEVTGLDDPIKYTAGNTYWRSEVRHFTPWDCNWPYAPPSDATHPNPENDPDTDEQCEEDCEGTANSYVEQRSRIYHEDISIPGTDITLHYASNRTKEYMRRISIPASGSSVPGSLQNIIVAMHVAGNVFKQTLDPLPNQVAYFDWDGLDLYGNPAGQVTATVKIGFVYRLVYSYGGNFSRAFSRIGRGISGLRRGQMTMRLWKEQQITVNGFQLAKHPIAEGWTLSLHHQLQQGPEPVRLFKGNGKVLEYNSTTIHTIAGTGTTGDPGDGRPADQTAIFSPRSLALDALGNLYMAETDYNRIRKVDTFGFVTTVAGSFSGFSGDGGPATSGRLSQPSGVAVDASGNLYIADSYNNRIRKVDVDGMITTFAGSGPIGPYERDYAGDGGPADQARLAYPWSVAVDPSGNLYIADSANHCIRMVDANGIITTVAGTGSPGYSGDNGPADQALLNWPFGVAIDPSGNLYIADGNNHRIRKVDTYGIITTVAGTGLPGYSGDNGPADQAQINLPRDVVLDGTGNLYIADSNNHRIRAVNTAGVITTIAGNGINGFSGDGGLASQAQLYSPHDMAVDYNSNIYVADYNNRRIRKVALMIGAFANAMTDGQLAIAEKTGVGHVLNDLRLHKSTIDLDTGVILREFGYDQDNNLVSITDQFGNVVSIERSISGEPTAIISPDNIRTEIIINANNHLEQVIYPDASGYRFEYTVDGLLTAEIDPNGNRFEHLFDESGRLTDVSDPEGGNWHYTRDTLEGGEIRTEVTSAEGNKTVFQDRIASRVYNSTITDENGEQTNYWQSADKLSVSKDLPCGTKLDFSYTFDPKFSYKMINAYKETLPSGLIREAAKEKNYEDTNNDEIIDRITTTLSINNRPITIIKDTLSSEVNITSPEDRSLSLSYDPITLRTKNLSIPGMFLTEYDYDQRGRLTTVRTNTREINYTYNSEGFIDSITDPENHTTTYSHDEIGRITGISRPDGSALGFSYDPNGNMTVLTNPVDVDHRFSFNRIDKPNGYQTPISGSYSYHYDRDRRLIQANFPSGKQINNIYTAAHLTQIQTPEGDIDLTYGCGGNVESITKTGETISYGYDGHLLTDVSLSGTLNQSVNYTYNSDFDIIMFTYAGGTVDYNYDFDGVLTGSGDFIITRNAENGLPESVVGNGLNINRTFSGYAEMDEQATIVSSQPVMQWSLARDDAGRIITKSEIAAGETHNYEYDYDTMGRLLSVTRDGYVVEEYGYDLSGARTSETNTLRGITSRGLSYSDENHLLIAGSTSYQYNLDGFLAAKTDGPAVTTYSYSSASELLQVNLPDDREVSYVHDPLRRRIAKRINGVIVEKYLWKGLTKLLAVYDGSDNLIQRFEYADGRLPVAMIQSGSTYFMAYDQVGSLKVVTDTSGNVIKRIDYDTFGNIIADTNSSFSVPYGFAGGLYDWDTGLIRFGYRDYDPDIGRWTAKDPIGFSGGDEDLYAYVQNNPVNAIDPYGLNTIVIPRFFIPRLVIPRFAPSMPIDPLLVPPYYTNDIDMKDTSTWPKPPAEGPCTEGEPSRKKPRKRGEKSLYDEKGGEWRPHLKDKYHPEDHWDYKPPSPNSPWQEVPMPPSGPIA